MLSPRQNCEYSRTCLLGIAPTAEIRASRDFRTLSAHRAPRPCAFSTALQNDASPVSWHVQIASGRENPALRDLWMTPDVLMPSMPVLAPKQTEQGTFPLRM